MKKIGFTLAEVLIVLAIIGTISSLTLPALIVKQKGSEIGAKLGRTRQILQAANEQYLLDEQLNNLSGIKGAPYYLYNIANKIKGAKFVSSGTMLLLPSGTQIFMDNIPPGQGRCALNTTTPEETDDNGNVTKEEEVIMNGSYQGEIACLRVNISPNEGLINGRNVFYFVVDQTGAVVPYGSKKLGSQETGCNANDTTQSGNLGCAGVIFDNNLKLPDTYKIPKS